MLPVNESIFKASGGLKTRWASPENPTAQKGGGGVENKGRKGRPCVALKAGESHVLAYEESASGMVRRIWITVNDRSVRMLRGLKLDFFWDGAEKPAVSTPLGDFFSVGLGRTAAFQSAMFSNPEGKSFNCYFPMPFKKGMKMTVTNESGIDLDAFFYDVDYTVGDRHDEDTLYFHAYYRREKQTQLKSDYEIVPPIQGRGRFAGCNIGVKADMSAYYRTWWGEGEVKCYIDGDNELPTLCGTGTEDYIGTGWGQGCYSHLYQGCPVADHDKFEYCFYRLHVMDPVFFDEDLRVTIQQIGCWDTSSHAHMHYGNRELYDTSGNKLNFAKGSGITEYGLFERSDDWSSCAYFYLDKPENGLPAIDAAESRME